MVEWGHTGLQAGEGQSRHRGISESDSCSQRPREREMARHRDRWTLGMFPLSRRLVTSICPPPTSPAIPTFAKPRFRNPNQTDPFLTSLETSYQ